MHVQFSSVCHPIEMHLARQPIFTSNDLEREAFNTSMNTTAAVIIPQNASCNRSFSSFSAQEFWVDISEQTRCCSPATWDFLVA